MEGKFEKKFEKMACDCGKPLNTEGKCENTKCDFFGIAPPKEKLRKVKPMIERGEEEKDYLLKHMMDKEISYVPDKTVETTKKKEEKEVLKMEQKEVLPEKIQKIVNEINSDFQAIINWWIKEKMQNKYKDRVIENFKKGFNWRMTRERILEPWEQSQILEHIEVPPEGKKIFEYFKKTWLEKIT